MFRLKQTETFRKWQLSLRDGRVSALIAARLDRIAYGHLGDASSVGHGISELRIHYGPGYRIYFQIGGDAVILLLCGGCKGMQSRDIHAARKLASIWKDLS